MSKRSTGAPSRRPIIAIDADGVMLDYNAAFAVIFKLAFGRELELADPSAFHATNQWGLPAMSSEEKAAFYAAADEHGIWRSMPAFPGAVEAVQALHDMGYDIVCVTSMPTEHGPDRLANLKALGFPIERVIATHRHGSENPKRAPIEELAPVFFIDDLLKNFEGIEKPGIQLVYLDREYSDAPNARHGGIARHMDVPTLAHFVDAVRLQSSPAPRAKAPR